MAVSKLLMVFSDIKIHKTTTYITAGEKGTFDNQETAIGVENMATILCVYFDADITSDVLITKIMILLAQSGSVVHEFGVDYICCAWGFPLGNDKDADTAVETAKKIIDLTTGDHLHQGVAMSFVASEDKVPSIFDSKSPFPSINGASPTNSKATSSHHGGPNTHKIHNIGNHPSPTFSGRGLDKKYDIYVS